MGVGVEPASTRFLPQSLPPRPWPQPRPRTLKRRPAMDQRRGSVTNHDWLGRGANGVPGQRRACPSSLPPRSPRAHRPPPVPRGAAEPSRSCPCSSPVFARLVTTSPWLCRVDRTGSVWPMGRVPGRFFPQIAETPICEWLYPEMLRPNSLSGLV